MYENLTKNKFDTKAVKSRKVSKITKQKQIRPVTANGGPKKQLYTPVSSIPIITEVGKKASSRLFNYEQK
jgi:hypothetical protein